MKKLSSLLLLLCLVLLLSPAHAEGKLSTTEKTLFTTPGDWSGYLFARVENTGDAPVYADYGGGKLVCFDADDNIIISEDYIYTSPSRIYLEPGDSVYVREHVLDNILETTTVADFKFSFTKDTSGYRYRTVQCEATLDYKGPDSYDNKVTVRLVNDSPEVVNNFCVVAAIYDQNGELAFVNDHTTSIISIFPGSTIAIDIPIDHDMAEYFALNGIVPTTINALLYITEE